MIKLEEHGNNDFHSPHSKDDNSEINDGVPTTPTGMVVSKMHLRSGRKLWMRSSSDESNECEGEGSDISETSRKKQTDFTTTVVNALAIGAGLIFVVCIIQLFWIYSTSPSTIPRNKNVTQLVDNHAGRSAVVCPNSLWGYTTSLESSTGLDSHFQNPANKLGHMVIIPNPDGINSAMVILEDEISDVNHKKYIPQCAVATPLVLFSSMNASTLLPTTTSTDVSLQGQYCVNEDYKKYIVDRINFETQLIRNELIILCMIFPLVLIITGCVSVRCFM